MDVVCGRCRAEYEFDDALISERGTTVRCTNCGLQFKVFPPVGRRSPEVWRVFNPADRSAEPLSFESLAELQRAIAQGAVTASFKLARGDEEPRALAEIVELQPLLRQPRTDHPPPVTVDVPAPLSVPARARSGTALGMELRPDPASRDIGPRDASPPPGFDEMIADDDDEEAVVPGTPDPPDELAVSHRTSPSSHPKIRSALSFAPHDDVVPPSSGKSGRASILPRTSLRSTLSGNYSSGPRSERSSSFPDSPAVAALPVVEARDSTSSDAGRDSDIPPELAGAVVAGDSVRESPLSPAPSPVAKPEEVASPVAKPEEVASPVAKPEEVASPVAKPEEVASPLAKIRTPSTPELHESPESVGGNMTPTPSAMRAYQTVDSQPVSAHARMPAPRRARSALVVIAVLLGGGLFVAVSNRDKLGELLGDSAATVAEAEFVVSADLKARLDAVETAWMRSAFFGKPDTNGVLQTLGLQSEIEKLGGKSSWEMVNLKRASGDLSGARAISSKLAHGGDSALSRAMLDYAESPEDPPWPVILDRLREAAAGERGKFLARTAHIYALGASGRVRQAKGDFEAFSRLSGAKQAPLHDDLEKFVASLVLDPEDHTGEAPAAGSHVAPATASVTTPPRSGVAEPADSAPVPVDEAAEVEPEPTPEDVDETAVQPSYVAKKVSKAVQDKVTRADSLWRGGDREGALVLYRQVVSEIGTSHFLGQRSAARIRQAEREKSGAN